MSNIYSTYLSQKISLKKIAQTHLIRIHPICGDSAAPWHIPLFCFHHSFTNVTSRSWQDTSTASLKLSTHQVDDVDLDEHITTSLVWYDGKIMLKYLSTPNSLCKMI